jgi:hypothetical protein
MSRRRRRRGGSGGQAGGQGGGDEQQRTAAPRSGGAGDDRGNRDGGGGGGGGSRSGRRGRRRGGKRGGNRGRKRDSAGFWGDAGRLPPAQPDIRISDDPSAVVRSLGPPPLPGHEKISEHYFAAVYDRAVMIAGALGAAGGLIEPEELAEELAEES